MKAKRFTAYTCAPKRTHTLCPNCQWARVVLAAEAEDEIAPLETQLQRAGRLYVEKCIELEAAERERVKALEAWASQLAELAEAKAERDEARATLAEYTRQPPTTLDVARAELAEARQIALSYKAEIERQVQDLASAERERDAADVALRGAAEAHDVLADELGTAKAERDELQERFENLSDICDRHISDNAQMRADRDEARAALEKRSGVAELRGVEAANRVLRAERDEARTIITDIFENEATQILLHDPYAIPEDIYILTRRIFVKLGNATKKFKCMEAEETKT